MTGGAARLDERAGQQGEVAAAVATGKDGERKTQKQLRSAHAGV